MNNECPILFVADEDGYYYWSDNCDATARVPASPEGRAWIREAERLLAEPVDRDDDDAQQAACDRWADHCGDLERIGGSWL
jgi:hypothetical protein